MADSNLLEDVRQEVKEPGDHDTLSHYVNKAKWGAALLSGDPVIALCGKVWHPTKDAQKYQVCGTCKDIYESLSS